MSALKIPQLPGDCTTEDIVAATEEAGVVVVESWLQPALLERFNSELEPWLEAHAGTNSGSRASDQFLGYKTRRLQGLVEKTPSFVNVLLDERLLGFCRCSSRTRCTQRHIEQRRAYRHWTR